MNRFLYFLLRYSSQLYFRFQPRLTQAGFLFFAVLVFTSATGMNTRLSTVFQLFSILLVLGIVAACCCIRFKPAVTAQRRLPAQATVGERFMYRIRVENQGKKPLRHLQLFDAPDLEYISYSEFHIRRQSEKKRKNRLQQIVEFTVSVTQEWLPLPDLLPATSIELRREATPLRRGLLHFSAMTLGRPDPFSLFRALSSIPCPDSLLVLPKRYPLPPLQLIGSRKYQPTGMTQVSVVGESQEFMSMREYRPGDPPRTIHWRSWAKTGRPMVKEYQDEFLSRHGLILDTFQNDGLPHTHADRCFEEAVSVAASLACTVADRDSLLDLLFVGNRAYCFTAGRSMGHSRQLLEVLAVVQPSPAQSFAELISLVEERSGQLSSCICVLLGWDEKRQDLIRSLVRRGLPVLPLVISEEEAEQTGQTTQVGVPVHFLHPDRMEEGLARL